MAKRPQRNIPVGKRRSAACLAAARVTLIIWLTITGRIMLAVLAFILECLGGPTVLWFGLDAPMARGIIKTFPMTNIVLLFGCAATV